MKGLRLLCKIGWHSWEDTGHHWERSGVPLKILMCDRCHKKISRHKDKP